MHTECTDVEQPNLHIPFRSALIIGICILAVFADTLTGFFVFDDFDCVYSANSYDFPEVLMGYETALEGRFLRPLPMLFYWLEAKSFGAEHTVFHLTTVLIHVAVTLLSANLLFTLFSNFPVTLVFAFLFAFFPNHSEVINSPAYNFDSWAVIFYLLSLNLFVYYRIRGRTRYFASSFLCYVAGTLCKELVYTLPLMLIILDLFLIRLRSISISWRKRVTEYAPFWTVILLVVMLTRYVFRLRIGYLTDAGDDVFSLYLGNFAMLFNDAAAILLRGIAFSFAPISPEFSHQAVIKASMLIGVAAAIVILAWRRAIDLRAVGFCLVSMSITLIPVIGAYHTIGLRHWSRFLYLPSVGSCYILSMIACGVGDRWKRKLIRIAVPFLFVIPFLALTKYYDRQWLDAQDITKRIVETMKSKYPAFQPYTRFYVSGIPWGHKGVPLFATGFPTAMGLVYDRKYVEGNLSFLPPNIVLDLAKENSREHDWTSPQYVLLSFDPETYSLTPAKTPEFASNARPPAFDFLKWADQTAMDISAGMSRIWGANMTYPLFIVTDKWAMLKLPPIRIGPPIKYVTFEMMLKKKANARDVVRLFWVTRKDTNYDGPKSIAFYADADGQFHTYRVPLYRNGLTLYDPGIRRFALRPSQNIGMLFSIKSMNIEYH